MRSLGWLNSGTRLSGQTHVDTHPLPRPLDYGIVDPLVIHSPPLVEVFRARAGVAFPGVDFQHLHLLNHESQIGTPQL